VSHTDPAILALRALGETVGTADDDKHAAACARCRDELARLSGLVALARQDGAGENLETPPAEVWERIAAAAGDVAGSPREAPRPGSLADGPAMEARPVRGSAERTGRHARQGMRTGWRHGRLAAGLAGLAAGLVVGIAGTAGLVRLDSAPPARVIARVELRPLPEFPQWRGARGTAVMQVTASQPVIDVTLTAPRQPGFYEVWLLARNGVSMISLGDLNAAHTGRFTVPAGTDLANYTRIDVSLQPFNGSTLHSRTSVVRGLLPPAAMSHGTGPTPAR
jgi:Anti-sigma-K factor rskA